MNWTGRQIAAATGGTCASEGDGPIVTDSRTLSPGAWFLALVGPTFDGHRFLAQVAEKGAAGVVVSVPPTEWNRGLVVVPDTNVALRDLGIAARDRLSGVVVGLTGSAGKTTSRALISLAVGAKGQVHQTTGNLNNQIGVPLTLLAAPEDAAVCVVELGTSLPGEIAILSEIARPNIRLIVNIGAAHLEELGGLEGVARETGALVDSARPEDVIALNIDDPHLAVRETDLRARGLRVISYGVTPEAEIRLLEATLDASNLSTRASFGTPEGIVSTVLPIPGVHIAHNAAGALAVAHALGLPLKDAAHRMSAYEPVGMRMRSEPIPGGALALNDAYNANPTSMVASLGVLAELGGRRVAVLGDMLELGRDEAQWHADVARRAGELALDLVVLVGPRMSKAGAACIGARELWLEPDLEPVAEKLRAWLRAGDRVLFKGSRGARVERILLSLQGSNAAETH